MWLRAGTGLVFLCFLSFHLHCALFPAVLEKVASFFACIAFIIRYLPFYRFFFKENILELKSCFLQKLSSVAKALDFEVFCFSKFLDSSFV